MKSPRYKIIYHFGDEIGLKTKAQGGFLLLDKQSILINGTNSIEVPFTSFQSIEMFRLQGLGRMIKLECFEQTVFLSVVWLNIGGYFAIINFFSTGKLFEMLKKQIVI